MPIITALFVYCDARWRDAASLWAVMRPASSGFDGDLLSRSVPFSLRCPSLVSRASPAMRCRVKSGPAIKWAGEEREAALARRRRPPSSQLLIIKAPQQHLYSAPDSREEESEDEEGEEGGGVRGEPIRHEYIEMLYLIASSVDAFPVVRPDCWFQPVYWLSCCLFFSYMALKETRRSQMETSVKWRSPRPAFTSSLWSSEPL